MHHHRASPPLFPQRSPIPDFYQGMPPVTGKNPVWNILKFILGSCMLWIIQKVLSCLKICSLVLRDVVFHQAVCLLSHPTLCSWYIRVPSWFTDCVGSNSRLSSGQDNTTGYWSLTMLQWNDIRASTDFISRTILYWLFCSLALNPLFIDESFADGSGPGQSGGFIPPGSGRT